MTSVDPHAGTILVLQRTQPWVRIASLVAFLLSGVMAFLGVEALVGGLASRRFETIPFLLVDFVFAVVFLAQALYLTKYANRIGLFVAQGHIVQLEAAMEAQRKFWKLSGLCAVLSLVALALVAGFALL
jgi:hypothetical protein